jgi:hypothetical protein
MPNGDKPFQISILLFAGLESLGTSEVNPFISTKIIVSYLLAGLYFLG